MKVYVLVVVGLLASLLPARGDYLYVADQGGEDILRVDTTTGAQTIISSGGYLKMLAGLALAPDGVFS